MLDSVLAQDDPHWQLVVVDDHSGEADLTEILDSYARRDRRIIIEVMEQNGGIGAATAHGIDRATGDYIALLDHDDMLTADAVRRVLDAVRAEPDADVLYSNEFRVDEAGAHPYRFLKPDFSPERLRSQMYFGHLVVYSRHVLQRIGGMRLGYDGSQDYDLALRASEIARRVVHIPRSIYKWRIHDSSVSHAKGNDRVFDSARRALTEHLARVGIDGVVEQTHDEGVYRIRRRLTDSPLVSIIIPTRGSIGTVDDHERVFVIEAVRSVIERSTYRNYEIIVVWDTGTPQSVLDALVALDPDRVRLVEYDLPFNFSAKINRGAVVAHGEYFLMLNDDVELIDPDWLEVMLAHFAAEDVGMVGSVLYFEDGTVQHAGHLYEGGNAGHIGIGEKADWVGVAKELHVEREVSGVTAACSVVRAELFFRVGGMSTTLPVNYNDVDFCLKVAQAGYRIIVTPYARMYHYESQTRISGVHPNEWRELNDRWGRLMLRDRFEPFPHRY
ncbi:glycosyltransferase family 2 protein [Epidermidibacterium keratini]